mmetsp:Transcript_47751/g.79217  ORF Transcript_47751/g.79217 Transcript_47751/m.79217 type:complete len:464 (+) Transcript_47751:29-1420(+)
MGKASKRRRRNWRKIDADALVTPSEPFSVEDEKARLERLRDSQLWSQDSAPRKKRQMTKAARKMKAKKKLLRRGFSIKSKATDDSTSSSKQVRIDTTKQAVIIKFSNGTKKAIKVDTHCDVKANQSRIRKNVDYNKNSKLHQFNLMHGKTKKTAAKDLWLDDDSETCAHDDSSNETVDDDESRFLPDVNVGKLWTAQKRAYAGHMSSKRSVHNGLIGARSLLSLPESGESINPLQHQYYHMKWRASQLRLRQFFAQQYRNEGTRKLCEQGIGVESSIDKRLQQMQTESNEWKKLYCQHRKMHQLSLKKLVWLHRRKKMQSNLNVIERQISQRERKNTFRSDVRNVRLRRKAMRKKMKLERLSSGKMYGAQFRFKPRATPSMSASALGHSLRRTMGSNVDHPLSFMFNEMQKQNKIGGAKRKKYIIRKRSFHGPRYRVQTRIGNLYHANVGKKLYEGLDDMETI